MKMIGETPGNLKSAPIKGQENQGVGIEIVTGMVVHQDLIEKGIVEAGKFE
tara:strand:- start:2595 stop:2747 length:153 start_codon:yes stop_codon:yes gene_type:complete